ncbi:hypothetical protein ACQKLX_07345 [Bosea sp. NPDC003192]|uniref:hypothetical protein n=1 Tax=Bosea sp. NPDC003192 TaxID=3390551 RepID=UPI003D01B9C9
MRLELLGRIPDEDEQGRYRDTAGGQYGRIDIADPLVRLGGALQILEKKNPRFISRDHYGRVIFDDCEAALRGDSRPIDRYLDNYLSYTNFESLKERRRGIHGINRVVINATVTIKDNLSVRLWMKVLDGQGRWCSAPEWRDIPYYGHTAVMERPNDEVLFIRDVNRLFVERAAIYGRAEKPDPIKLKIFEASCELVNSIFWLTVQRLAQRFEVTLARYVVMLRESRDGRILGLEVGDALDERKNDIKRSLANFEVETGWATEEFWAACEGEPSAGRRYATASSVKRLRAKDAGTVKLTAGEVDRRLDLLSTAEAYGFWKPARGASPDKVVSLFQSPAPALLSDSIPAKPSAPTEQPTPRGASAPIEKPARASPALVPYLRRNFTPSRPPEELHPNSPQPKSQFDPPSYVGLRSAPWTEELTREFAVEGTHDFVAFLNQLRRAENRLPVPQGSFPAKASDLERLVKEARLARARQQHRPDPGSNSVTE